MNARAATAAAGGILYDHNFGFGPVIASFAWIFVAHTILGALPVLSPRLSASMFYESITRSANTRRGQSETGRALADEHDPATYVRKVVFGWLPASVIGAAVLLAVATGVTLRELTDYTVFTTAGSVQRHTLPRTPTTHHWSDATIVELGCNHVGGRNAANEPVYIVHFNDGVSIRLDDGRPIEGAWLDQIEKIDAQLVAAGAQFRPWRWQSQTPQHPACVDAQLYAQGEGDFERLRHLLRITPAQ